MRFADELAATAVQLRELQAKYDDLREKAISELQDKKSIVGEQYIIELKNYEKIVVDQSSIPESELSKYQTTQEVSKINILETKTGNII